MKKRMIRKGIVLGLILLFIGASVVSSIGYDFKDQGDKTGINVNNNIQVEEAEYTYYYTENGGNVWSSNPGYFVDGNPDTCASTSSSGQIHDVTVHNGSEEITDITKVEIRVRGKISDVGGNYYKIYPRFGGSTVGDVYDITAEMKAGPAWSSWQDITSDSQAPGTWTWQDVLDLDVRIIPTIIHTDYAASGYKVELRCTGSEFEFKTTFIIGKIDNLNTDEDMITFEAVNIRCIQFFPFGFIPYTSGELIIISEDYIGVLTPKFIFAVCGANI